MRIGRSVKRLVDVEGGAHRLAVIVHLRKRDSWPCPDRTPKGARGSLIAPREHRRFAPRCEPLLRFILRHKLRRPECRVADVDVQRRGRPFLSEGSRLPVMLVPNVLQEEVVEGFHSPRVSQLAPPRRTVTIDSLHARRTARGRFQVRECFAKETPAANALARELCLELA